MCYDSYKLSKYTKDEKMKGSEKQIKWATSIIESNKSEWLEYAEAHIDILRDKIAKNSGKTICIKGVERNLSVEGYERAIGWIEGANKCFKSDDAGAIIDARHALAFNFNNDPSVSAGIFLANEQASNARRIIKAFS